MGKDHERGYKDIYRQGRQSGHVCVTVKPDSGRGDETEGQGRTHEKQMKELVADRVAMIRKANPEQTDKKVPVDLVTCSGSGLDPGISVAAAEYQIPRLVKTTGKSEAELRKIVDKYTVHKFLGIFGEEYVNVLKVNLALEGILK